MFRSIVFTVIYLGLKPTFSQTISSDRIRIHEIMKLIRESRLGIHDLSRNISRDHGEYARFNLPYELGLDVGCKSFGGRKYCRKKFLILDQIPHTYDRYLSDISGQDIEIHNNDPERLTKQIRDWIKRLHSKKQFDSGEIIWRAFNQFNEDLSNRLTSDYLQFELNKIQIIEYAEYAEQWIETYVQEKSIA